MREAGGKFGAERYGRLGGPARRIAPIEAILHEDHRVAQSCAARSLRSRDVEVICDYGDENGQVEIAEESPGEIEIAFVRERGPGRGGDA